MSNRFGSVVTVFVCPVPMGHRAVTDPGSPPPRAPECTKIAHRRALAIFTEGIAGKSATRTIFTHFLRRRNRGSLTISSHILGPQKIVIFGGAVKIAAAAAENRAILVHPGPPHPHQKHPNKNRPIVLSGRLSN